MDHVDVLVEELIEKEETAVLLHNNKEKKRTRPRN